MDFTVVNGEAVRMLIEPGESEAVKIAADNLRMDLKKVLRVKFSDDILSCDAPSRKKTDDGDGKAENADRSLPVILIGTLGVSGSIQTHISREDFADENGALRKEAYLLSVRENRLIIAGSDRRGTIYGIYELSEMLGVSPWYFWADVPVRERDSFSLQDGYRKFDYPGIEYRGIFINDEEELDHWVRLHMGEDTIGVKTYEKIFELLLRLKGNYIWPAMHVNSFNVKKENGALADKMGVVVGTSHCDMLMRSNNREWRPWLEKKGYTDAKYDYSIEGRNREILKEYWRESVEQNQEFEVSYTLGMRGIHDSGFETEHLAGGTPEELRQQKMKLLETIIHDQEKIIEEVLCRESNSSEVSGESSAAVCDDRKSILKLFIPYKEVLELYDNGLRLPEDLTLVWSNDNYGYVRRYPSEEAGKRRGGNGIYYHNSYWAPPGRSYLFISSIPLAQTKYELEKAYDNGIRKLWVTNMGAIKPLEQEMEFVLRLAWETGKEYDVTAKNDERRGCQTPTERMSASGEPQPVLRRTVDVDDYLTDWIDRNFTGGHGRETAALLNDFAQVTNTRKIEVMEEDVFPQTGSVNEAAVRLNKLRTLYQKGNEIYEALPAAEQPAFFQMVLMKIHAAYYTGAMYYFADRSALPAERKEGAADYVEYTRFFEDLRRKMLVYYNEKMCDGKWRGIVTPEDFPPPRTAMFPAAVPPVKGAAEQESRINDHTMTGEENAGIHDIVAVRADSLSSNNRSAGWRVIRRLGRGGGDLLEAYEPGAVISYPVTLPAGGDYLLELHRYPSLNSVGRIRVMVRVDHDRERLLESVSNDEWRGSWEVNTLDQVDRIYLKLPELCAGSHRIHFRALDRYFAFSGFVLYPLRECRNKKSSLPEGSEEADRDTSFTKEGKIFDDSPFSAEWGEISDKVNCISFLTGDDTLSGKECVEEARKIWYSELPLSPRPLICARWEDGGDSLSATDEQFSMEEVLGKEAVTETTAEELLAKGKQIFSENDGTVRIEAFAAWGQTSSAYTTNYDWTYCVSETHNRSGIAMHIREKNRVWDTVEAAPSLHYRFSCKRGSYVIWALTYVTCPKNGRFAVSIDDMPVAKDRLYRGGNLWKYEAEHIWRLTPIAKVELTAGEHLMSFSAFAAGLRADSFIIKPEAGR
ncbi:MAG: glycosyl hydrolase 115 family protein [Lachnospiraceae bacterium]|nr:glycosyl hydrolase 115 family protein [Lachnospiraceae bacterium]